MDRRTGQYRLRQRPHDILNYAVGLPTLCQIDNRPWHCRARAQVNALTPLEDRGYILVGLTSEEWIEQPLAEEIVLTGATTNRYFDAQQGVRVRITPKHDTFTVKLLITVEGTP